MTLGKEKRVSPYVAAVDGSVLKTSRAVGSTHYVIFANVDVSRHGKPECPVNETSPTGSKYLTSLASRIQRIFID